MLDELGAVNISHQDRRHKWLINLLHQIDGMFALRSDHNAIGMHQIALLHSLHAKIQDC